MPSIEAESKLHTHTQKQEYKMNEEKNKFKSDKQTMLQGTNMMH